MRKLTDVIETLGTHLDKDLRDAEAGVKKALKKYKGILEEAGEDIKKARVGDLLNEVNDLFEGKKEKKNPTQEKVANDEYPSGTLIQGTISAKEVKALVNVLDGLAGLLSEGVGTEGKFWKDLPGDMNKVLEVIKRADQRAYDKLKSIL